MHNKYATFVLPVLAGLAIVGAGFSTWVFEGSNDASTSIKGTGTLTGVADLPAATVQIGKITDGTFSKLDSFTLTLDQGGLENMSNNKVGITSDPSSFDYRWTITKAAKTQYLGFNVTLSASLTYEGEGSSVTFVQPAAFEVTSAIGSLPEDGENAYLDVDANLASVWEYTNKPTTLSSYQAMSTALADESYALTLTVTATFSVAALSD